MTFRSSGVIVSPYVYMFATDFRSIAGECRFENLQFAFLKLTKTYAGFDRDKGAVSQKSGCAILVRPQGALIPAMVKRNG
jgi:hypothetical protein